MTSLSTCVVHDRRGRGRSPPRRDKLGGVHVKRRHLGRHICVGVRHREYVAGSVGGYPRDYSEPEREGTFSYPPVSRVPPLWTGKGTREATSESEQAPCGPSIRSRTASLVRFGAQISLKFFLGFLYRRARCTHSLTSSHSHTGQ